LGCAFLSRDKRESETRFIKFQIVPVRGEVTLTEHEAKSADFLYDDLKSRSAAGTIRFSALLRRPGDPTLDVTIRWPDEDSREAVRLGTIVITGIEANEACDASVFDPSNLAEGIGYPPDEIFAARAQPLLSHWRSATDPARHLELS
jgi:catalase